MIAWTACVHHPPIERSVETESAAPSRGEPPPEPAAPITDPPPCVGLLTEPPPARDEPPSDEAIEEARALRDAAARGYSPAGPPTSEAYRAALASFCAAYRVSAREPLLYNIAVTYEQLGAWARAADFYELFVARRTRDGAPDDSELRERARRLRDRSVAPR